MFKYLFRYLLIVMMAFACVVTSGACVYAASVEVQLYPLTGDVRLSNPNAAEFDFIFYELDSAASAFTGMPGGWTSISDTYDASGNGFIDPINQWIELSATSSQVTESLFVGTGSNLPTFRSIGLGQIWDPETVMPNDVTATFLAPNLQTADVEVVVALAGDYNHDLIVDALDYTTWRTALGSLTDPQADGNFDGMVDAADYTVWRDNFGLSLIAAGFGSLANGGSTSVGVPTVVPEPASGLLAMLAGLSLLLRRRSRQLG